MSGSQEESVPAGRPGQAARRSGTWGQRERRRNLKLLGRVCDELLAGLMLPKGADIFALCQGLSQQRGRAVKVVPVELPDPQLYGIWFSTDEADFIAYEKRTSRLHQEHIIAHELAHIVRGHRGIGSGPGAATGAGTLFPHLDPKVVRSMRPRAGYSDGDEQEAEAMASLLLARLRQEPDENVWQVPETEAETVARIENVVGLPHAIPRCSAPRPDPETP